MHSLSNKYALLVLLGLASCIDSYEPKLKRTTTNFLVVDGGIVPQGNTVIRLSRTIAVSDTQVPKERNARVFIEEESGRQYRLTESSAGVYSSASLTLDPAKRVRLHLTTTENKEYVSDYTTVKLTPPIDSISWRIGNKKLEIYANTHDATNLSRYFRWSYDETWEFTSRFSSALEYKNGRIVPRTNNIYNCWGTQAPSTIVLGNTLRLGQNVISEQPITQILDSSPKLRIRYSILVKQYALTLEEYNYFEALRKNTENIGTLFDPLPTQLTGNVHCINDPEEPVLGFVGAQSVIEKRIFIERSQLPSNWPYVTGYENCGLDTIPRAKDPDPPKPEAIVTFFGFGAFIPVAYNPQKNEYYYSTTDCIDCRRRGTNVKPSFWP